MKIIFLTVLIFMSFQDSLLAVNGFKSNNLDSLISEINSSFSGTKRIDAVNSVVRSDLSYQTRKCIDITNLTLKSAFEINYRNGIAESYHNLGKGYYLINYYEESDSLLKLAIQYYESENHYESAVRAMIDRANTLKGLNENTKALKLLNDALKIAVSKKPEYEPVLLQEIGNLYTKTGDIIPALEFLNKSLEKFKKIGNKYMLPYIKVDLGSAHLKSSEPTKALNFFSESRKDFESQNNQILIAQSYKYEGDVHKSIGNVEQAAQEYLKALNIYESSNDMQGKKSVLFELYLIESMRNNIDFAHKYLEQYTYLLRDELNTSMIRKETEKKLSSETIQRQIAQNRVFEKERELNFIKNENEIQRLENENQSSWITFFIIMSIMLIIIAIILFYLFKNKKKNNTILTDINNELKTKNILIDSQNNELILKNQSILDSINYARRIQKAILPIESSGKSLFKDYFVLYIPKDIVSGDFYWFTESEEFIFAAAVDCTGHGVSGAFMSMIGNTMLNEIVSSKKIYEPKNILNSLNNNIRTALKQDYEIGANDGMDMGIVRVSKKTNRIVFAGAKRPLYIIEKSNFREIKGDKYSIGGRVNQITPDFRQHEVTVEDSAYLYLSTDGYADQSNPENKKFGRNRLRDFLITISEKSSNEQLKCLHDEFDKHKSDEPQRDDVTILGIKVSK